MESYEEDKEGEDEKGATASAVGSLLFTSCILILCTTRTESHDGWLTRLSFLAWLPKFGVSSIRSVTRRWRQDLRPLPALSPTAKRI